MGEGGGIVGQALRMVGGAHSVHQGTGQSGEWRDGWGGVLITSWRWQGTTLGLQEILSNLGNWGVDSSQGYCLD